jgi:short-subunit dehydrogenase involved in D-alanine esterification of teichoic acids
MCSSPTGAPASQPLNPRGIIQPDAAWGHIDDARMVATVTTNLMEPIRLTSTLIDHLKGKNDAVVVRSRATAVEPYRC